MKNNIIFALLTALIVGLGFFGVSFCERYLGNNGDTEFVTVERSGGGAVYLSTDQETIHPFGILEEYPENSAPSPLYRECSIATATIKVMSRYNKAAEIFDADSDQLIHSWKCSKNGYLYLKKWHYQSPSKAERLLDCIIDRSDMSIVYIRFYSGYVPEMPAQRINKALKRFDSESAKMYPELANMESYIQLALSQAQQDFTSYYMDSHYDPNSIFRNYHDGVIRINSHTHLLDTYSGVTDNFRRELDIWTTNSKLSAFWMSGAILTGIEAYDYYDMYDMMYDEYAGVMPERIVNIGVTNALYAVMSRQTWYSPAYSSRDDRIYQTIDLGGGERLTVIYSIVDEMIEGYYHEIN